MFFERLLFLLSPFYIHHLILFNYIKDFISNGADLNNTYIDHAFVKLNEYEKNIKHWKEVKKLLETSIPKQDEERTRILKKVKEK